MRIAALVFLMGMAAAAEPVSVEGWTLHVSPRLSEEQPEATAQAVDLLRRQLAEINKFVPAPALVHLHRVPLWFSPVYPEGERPRAEYHPGAAWLTEHGRDPVMAKAVEFTNIAIFEKECRRMPFFVLHELAHAYHDQVLGFEHPEILAAYEKAKADGAYNDVERWFGGKMGRDRAYALGNAREAFAETTEAYFGRNDFQPFDRAELVRMDPTMDKLLERLWKGK